MTDDSERCIRCPHGRDDHDDALAYCLHDGCTCLAFVSETDDLENAIASGEDPEELDFDSGR